MTRTAAPIAHAPDHPGFDPSSVRGDFPILQAAASGRSFVYFDNGATTQKPQAVIDAERRYYEQTNANIHRGVYRLSQEATDAYEAVRGKVRRFINAADDREIVFTSGTTASINLVAFALGRSTLKPGDEVLVSTLDHHSNIVPWQMACEATGATLRAIPIHDDGELDWDEFGRMLTARTKVVSVTHLSNALGTINDGRRIGAMAHGVGARVLLDGAQWIAHYPTDVQDLGCDFYTFSAHKLYGPTGVGVLYGKFDVLESMPPFLGGGDMIASVSFEKTTYAQVPSRFEAGTPNIAGVVGLGAAIDYLSRFDLDAIAAHEDRLLRHATARLSAIAGLRIVGTAPKKSGIISFVVENPPLASHDLGVMLDLEGIAIRTGHHCCQPLMDRLGVPSTARASFAMYNTLDEVDRFADALERIVASQRTTSRAAPAPTPAEPTTGDGLRFPEPAGANPTAVAEELAEMFDLLGDRETRSRYLLELGESLPPMPKAFKTESSRVRGCMSTVHLVGRHRPGTPDTVDILADSDAHIVRGLIALLQKLYSGQRAGDVLAFDIEGMLRRVGLDQFISTQRRNGLAGMIQRIRAVAQEVADKPAADHGRKGR